MATATATKLPKFTGKSLIEISEDIHQADFLRGDFAQAVLKEYQGRCKEYGEQAQKALNVLVYDISHNLVRGSNSYSVILMNQVLQEEGLRTATQADLERVLKTNALDLRGTYEDSALALRSEENPNIYLAKNIVQQIKHRKRKVLFPIMIPLTSLSLCKDSSAPFGVSFQLQERAHIIHAPILNKQGNFNGENIDEKTGLPKRTGEGSRTLYTRNEGLSRFYINRNGDLNAGYGCLADSYDNGQVVVVRGEAA